MLAVQRGGYELLAPFHVRARGAAKRKDDSQYVYMHQWVTTGSCQDVPTVKIIKCWVSVQYVQFDLGRHHVKDFRVKRLVQAASWSQCVSGTCVVYRGTLEGVVVVVLVLSLAQKAGLTWTTLGIRSVCFYSKVQKAMIHLRKWWELKAGGVKYEHQHGSTSRGRQDVHSPQTKIKLGVTAVIKYGVD